MDNFSDNDNPRSVHGEQTSQSVADCYGLTNPVEFMDRWYRHLGAAAAQYRPVGAVHTEPSQVAFSAEVRHTMGSANDRQVGGSHYQDINATGVCPHCRGEIQHWDWAGRLPGLEYAATKYLSRWRLKQPFESLQKVLHYVQKIIEQNFPNVRVTITVEDMAEIPEAKATMGGIHTGSK